ncbi:hypothetical protein B0H10DRAFT_2052554 [Mycena sp. CBHHK59/15]|nr:hypothetical protein B0H10DRAFT_2052554 [Mycena sp. CBHHK59/15]
MTPLEQTSTCLGPTLPPEITDSIIHQFHSSSPDLRVCSLVCRAWLPASRYQLFSSLSLRGEDIPKFVDLIASPENTYSSSLRAITIIYGENGPMSLLLLRLLDFRSLRSMKIRLSMICSEFPTMPHITFLKLDAILFQSFSAFITFLIRFPGLKILVLRHLGWGPDRDSKDPVQSITAPRLELEQLSIENSHNLQLLSWLSDVELAPLTSSLSLDLTGRMGRKIIPDVAEYLQHLRTHLKHLHLQLHTIARFLEKLDFSLHTQSLRIHSAVEFSGDSGQWSLCVDPMLLQVLKLVCAPHIKELTLRVVPVRRGKLIIPDTSASLQLLLSVLHLPHLATLRKIQFYGPWNSDPEARDNFTSVVLDKLPTLASRSVVLVDSSPS